jgi:uncharacterized protein YecE (DUF72 family)
MEIRHASFLVPEFMTLLKRHKIALVFADTAGLWPYAEDVTADFIYLRLHGAEQIYVSGYTGAALSWWSERIRTWSAGGQPADGPRILKPAAGKRRGRDVFAYFDNDAKVCAPFDAMNLQRRLGLGGSDPHRDGDARAATGCASERPFRSIAAAGAARQRWAASRPTRRKNPA